MFLYKTLAQHTCLLIMGINFLMYYSRWHWFEIFIWWCLYNVTVKVKVNNGTALTSHSSESHMAPLLLTLFSTGFRGQVASEAPSQPGYLWLFFPKVIFLSVIAGGVLNPTCQEITQLAVKCTWSICHDERKWIAQPLESLSVNLLGEPLAHVHIHTDASTPAETAPMW